MKSDCPVCLIPHCEVFILDMCNSLVWLQTIPAYAIMSLCLSVRPTVCPSDVNILVYLDVQILEFGLQSGHTVLCGFFFLYNVTVMSRINYQNKELLLYIHVWPCFIPLTSLNYISIYEISLIARGCHGFIHNKDIPEELFPNLISDNEFNKVYKFSNISHLVLANRIYF